MTYMDLLHCYADFKRTEMYTNDQPFFSMIQAIVCGQIDI